MSEHTYTRTGGQIQTRDRTAKKRDKKYITVKDRELQQEAYRGKKGRGMATKVFYAQRRDDAIAANEEHHQTAIEFHQNRRKQEELDRLELKNIKEENDTYERNLRIADAIKRSATPRALESSGDATCDSPLS